MEVARGLLCVSLLKRAPIHFSKVCTGEFASKSCPLSIILWQECGGGGEGEGIGTKMPYGFCRHHHVLVQAMEKEVIVKAKHNEGRKSGQKAKGLWKKQERLLIRRT